MKNKKKKRSKKAHPAVKGKQVSRPSYKKPRPKKHVEPKLPKLGIVPEGVPVPELPKEEHLANDIVLTEEDILGKTSEELFDFFEENFKRTIDKIDYKDDADFRTHAEEQDMLPITIKVELPPGKTEEDVAKAINIASSLMSDKYEAAIDEVRNIWGAEYHSKGTNTSTERMDLIDGWSGDKVKKSVDVITKTKSDQELADALIGLTNAFTAHKIKATTDVSQKLGWFGRLRNWFNK